MGVTLYHMKMVLIGLKKLTLKVHITVSVITMALMQMNHGCIGIDFIRQIIFGDKVKAKESSPPDNLTRWIITRSKGFARKGIEKINRSVRAYVYLVLTSQVQASSSIVGNSAPAVDAQQVFKSTFKALINEDYSIGINIERYQGVLEHALSKVDCSVGTDIYMLPSNLNLSIGKRKGYKNKILVSNTGMKIG